MIGMGLLHKIMPTRDAFSPPATPVKVIADLDLLISQPIGFKYLGRDYVIDPMTTRNYIEVVKGLHDIEVLTSNRDSTTLEDTYQAYYKFVHALCKTMTLEDIKKATLPQLAALMNLLIRHIKGETTGDMVGEPQVEDVEKKKRR